ncbi:MAG: hypothetical protein GQ474_03185, partial [Sulfurimonas sp.]|nr:hypothetical protein [Sulfurimonas sp.]
MERITFVSSILKPDVLLAMCLALVLNHSDNLNFSAFSHATLNGTTLELVDFKYNYFYDPGRQERRGRGEKLIFFDSRNAGHYEPSWYYHAKSAHVKSLTELVWSERRESVSDKFLKNSLDKFVQFVNNFNSWSTLTQKDLQYQTLVNRFVLKQSVVQNDYKIHTNVDLGPSYLPKFISDRLEDLKKIRDNNERADATMDLVLKVSQKIHLWLKNERKILYVKENIKITPLTDLVDLIVIEDSTIDGRGLKYIINKIYQEKKIIGRGFILISTYNNSVGKFSNHLNINVNIENAIASINTNHLKDHLTDIYKIPSYSYKSQKGGLFISIADAVLYAGLVNNISEF